MTETRRPPEKIEPIKDGKIKKTWKFWKRTPKPNLDKKHECYYLKALNQLNEQWKNHDCESDLEIFNFVSILGGSIEFADWLREVLAVKKWKKCAEEKYFLKFEFAEVLE